MSQLTKPRITRDYLIHLINTNVDAVYRAMRVLDNNSHLITSKEHEDILSIYPYPILVKKFAFYLQGFNNNGKKKFQPKPLTHKHCTPIFYKQGYVEKGVKVIDVARRIALDNIEFLHYKAILKKNPDADIDFLPQEFAMGSLYNHIRRDSSHCFAVRKDIDETREYSSWPESVSKQEISEDDFNRYVQRTRFSGLTKHIQSLGWETVSKSYNFYRFYRETVD